MRIIPKYPTQITGGDLFLVIYRKDGKPEFWRISSIDYKDRGAWIRTGNDTASSFFTYDEKVFVAA